jgi:sugar-specific transcriptional regulator TrmB
MCYGKRRRETAARRADPIRGKSILGAVTHAFNHSHQGRRKVWRSPNKDLLGAGSAEAQGLVHVYSGVPLLFKAVEPLTVFEKVKGDLETFLQSVQATLKEEVNEMKEKFVIKKFDIGLKGLKQEIGKAKTVEINNATASFVKKVSNSFRSDAVVKVLMFPGEAKPINMKHAELKEAEIAIVTIIRNREVPSMSIILDEGRTFTAFQDPVDHKYIVDEMLYDECSRCFSEWSNLSWNAGN